MPPAPESRPRRSWPNWIRDPLVVFLGLGAAIFAIEQWVASAFDEDQVIVVGQADVDHIAALWQTQMGRPPTTSELDALLDDHVREEVMVREAKRLALDQDDAIIRRRLAQKLAFLTEDLATLAPPTEAALRTHFEANKDRYATPAVVTFSHIYFSPDRRDDPAGDAERGLATLDPDAWRKAGDPFMLGRTYAHASVSRIGRDFGSGFLAGLDALDVGPGWQGPIDSAYGSHLVRLDARTPALGADYESVAARVLRDYDAERRAAANAAHFEELKGRYEVVLP